MGKYSKEDYEFEKNKQAILQLTQNKKTLKPDDAHQSLWEYEISEHRHRKKREKMLMFGAYCGILSLLVSCFLVVNLYFKFIG